MNQTLQTLLTSAKADVAAAIIAGEALAAAPAIQKTEDGRPFLLMPNAGGGLEFKDLSNLLPHPMRLTQTIALHTPGSFGDYVNLFGDKTRTLIVANRDTNVLTALLDYHADPKAPSWVGHKATCELETTQPWDEWVEKHDKPMNQADFAQFLEDHLPEIASPDGALLVEIARTFEAKKNVSFKSHVRATDGSVNFAYEEDVQGTAKASQVKIPTSFTLVLTPYYGSKQAQLEARLRYRIGSGGALALTFQLIRHEDVLEAAFLDVVEAVKAATVEHVRAVVIGQVG